MKNKIFNIRNIVMFGFIIAISLFQVLIMHMSKIDADLLWHYKLGEEIVKTGAITSVNNFTFLEGTEWIHQEWLYEVILYFIIANGDLIGYFAICMINSVVLWCIAVKNKHNLILFSILSFLILYLTPRNIGNRPSEFSMYFLIAIIYLYNKNIKKIKWIIYLLLGILIANFHGGTILVTTAVTLIMIVSDIFTDLYTGCKLSLSYYITKIANLVIFITGTLLNPSGAKLLSTIVKIPKLETTQYITEWMPTEVGYISGIILLGIMISFGYYIGKYGIVKEDLQLILVNTALLILSLHSRKAFILFDIVWLVYGYKYLEVMLIDIFDNKLNKLSKLSILKSTIPAFIVVIGMVSVWCFDLKQDNFDDYANSFRNSDILNELKDRYTDGDKILASYSDGNYILYNDMKCFVDTRQWPYVKELSDCEALDELFYVINYPHDRDYIDEFIDKYSFDYIWTNDKLDLNDYLEDRQDFKLIVITDNEYESLWKRVR